MKKAENVTDIIDMVRDRHNRDIYGLLFSTDAHQALTGITGSHGTTSRVINAVAKLLGINAEYMVAPEPPKEITMPGKHYRRRSFVVRAIQFHGYNRAEVEKWLRNMGANYGYDPMPEGADTRFEPMAIISDKGRTPVEFGDYLVSTSFGNVDVMSPRRFEETHEPCDPLRDDIEYERAYMDKDRI